MCSFWKVLNLAASTRSPISGRVFSIVNITKVCSKHTSTSYQHALFMHSSYSMIHCMCFPCGLSFFLKFKFFFNFLSLCRLCLLCKELIFASNHVHCIVHYISLECVIFVKVTNLYTVHVLDLWLLHSLVLFMLLWALILMFLVFPFTMHSKAIEWMDSTHGFKSHGCHPFWVTNVSNLWRWKQPHPCVINLMNSNEHYETEVSSRHDEHHIYSIIYANSKIR
jgi:hypothetical protein